MIIKREKKNYKSFVEFFYYFPLINKTFLCSLLFLIIIRDYLNVEISLRKEKKKEDYLDFYSIMEMKEKIGDIFSLLTM